MFVPARRRGREILDDREVDAATRVRSIGDVTRSNRLFGGLHAALTEVAAAIGETSRDTKHETTILDVGTGLADIPAAIRESARRRGITVRTIGLDEAGDLLVAARDRMTFAVCSSATALPFRDHSIDIVLCSQLLHHFGDDDLASILRELDRVARGRVIIADLRRSWIAAAGFWLASFPLRFDPVTRHDGVVSVFRGFTSAELHREVRRAVGVRPQVRRRIGFRLTVSWEPLTSRVATP